MDFYESKYKKIILAFILITPLLILLSVLIRINDNGQIEDKVVGTWILENKPLTIIEFGSDRKWHLFIDLYGPDTRNDYHEHGSWKINGESLILIFDYETPIDVIEKYIGLEASGYVIESASKDILAMRHRGDLVLWKRAE